MSEMYNLDAFTTSCPADQDIISHYRMQQVGQKSSARGLPIRGTYAENPDPQESIQDPAFSHSELQSSRIVDLAMAFVVDYMPYGASLQKPLKSCDTLKCGYSLKLNASIFCRESGYPGIDPESAL
jgi:hypothetical protein